MFITAPHIGRLSAKMDTRILVGIGLITASFGVWMNSHMTPLAGMEELFWPQILRGVGLMCAMIVMSQLALSTKFLLFALSFPVFHTGDIYALANATGKPPFAKGGLEGFSSYPSVYNLFLPLNKCWRRQHLFKGLRFND